MIYVFVALYPEAKPIIHRLGLKRERAAFGFDTYAADRLGMRLVITGVGMVAAAAAVGSTLGYYHVGRDSSDIALVNFGSCAGEGRVGDVFLCNKIIERTSGHAFYPDMVYSHNLAESFVVTEPYVLEGGLVHLPDRGLHDMEAAAVYQAGARFLGPHQMSFIKVISDAGRGGGIQAEKLEEIMGAAAEPFVEYLMGRAGLVVEEGRRTGNGRPGGGEEAVSAMVGGGSTAVGDSMDGEICGQELELLCQQLHCSETMRMAVRQCIKYWSLAGIDYRAVLRQMRERGELPCKDRREGKKRFEELKGRLL